MDNYIYEERVKGYYQHPDHLKAAYKARYKHFKATFKSELHALSDADRKRFYKCMSAKQYRREVAHQLHKVTPRHDYYPLISLETYNYLRSLDERVTRTFDAIGLEGLEQTGYVYSKMDKAVKGHKETMGYRTIAPQVYGRFKPFNTYPESEILATLTAIRGQAGLSGRTTATMIKKFFKARRSSSKKVVVWILEERLEPNTPNYLID